ncbi:hypothetical protein C8J57DRAFT_186074 [Mycena rebaudengoi]|nr:hypothetical protein C8J57DRAFT_186074 [Mycena rebaudengoi]
MRLNCGYVENDSIICHNAPLPITRSLQLSIPCFPPLMITASPPPHLYPGSANKVLSGSNVVALGPIPGGNGQLAFAVTSSVAFAIIVWEYATHLPDELRLYRKPVWGTVPPYAFLMLRYGGVLATLPALFISAIETPSCQFAASLSQAGIILVILSSGIMFAFRLCLLWKNQRAIQCILGVTLVCIGACWIVVSSQYIVIPGPPPPFGSNCRVLPTVHWAPLSFGFSTAYFLMHLVLTLLKMQYQRDSLAAYRAYRDNVIYLIITTSTFATMLLLQSLSPPSNLLVLSATPFATVIAVATGTRCFRNLTISARLEDDKTQAAPYPSSSPITQSVDQFRYIPPARLEDDKKRAAPHPSSSPVTQSVDQFRYIQPARLEDDKARAAPYPSRSPITRSVEQLRYIQPASPPPTQSPPPSRGSQATQSPPPSRGSQTPSRQRGTRRITTPPGRSVASSAPLTPLPSPPNSHTHSLLSSPVTFAPLRNAGQPMVLDPRKSTWSDT